ncbi:MAG: FixH family protein [Bacteroidota bacterium]
MQINWGKKLIIVYCSFVVGMLFMVYKTTRHKSEMVTTEYYEKELKYQEVINGLENANGLATAAKVVEDGDFIVLSMPSEALQAKGLVEFYRPSDASKDFSMPLVAGADGKQLFDRQKFTRGLYKVKITWNKDGKQFFAEQSLFIQ